MKPAWKRVKETADTEIVRDSWNVPSVIFYVNAKKFQLGDLVRVTVTLLKRKARLHGR